MWLNMKHAPKLHVRWRDWQSWQWHLLFGGSSLANSHCCHFRLKHKSYWGRTWACACNRKQTNGICNILCGETSQPLISQSRPGVLRGWRDSGLFVQQLWLCIAQWETLQWTHVHMYYRQVQPNTEYGRSCTVTPLSHYPALCTEWRTCMYMYSAFCIIWQTFLPHIMETKPMSDLCWACTIRTAMPPWELLTSLNRRSQS